MVNTYTNEVSASYEGASSGVKSANIRYGKLH